MPNDALSCTDICIRVDEPTPCRIIVPALEVIQPGLLWLCIAVGTKLDKKKLEITGSKSADYAVPGEGLPLPGVGY